MEPKRMPSALATAVLAVALVLCATAEERTFGSVTDEQQILGTAASLVLCGELGLPRGATTSIRRPEGDAVAPYGLGLPLLQAPLMAMAGPLERAMGAGASQALLILLPLALVSAAAACAGLLARTLGAPPAAQAVAVIATGLGSPLWSLASSAFTEPLQAVALAGAALCAMRAARAASRKDLAWACAAGALASWAVMTKGVNLVIAPFTLLPIVLDHAHAGERAGSSAITGAFRLLRSRPFPRRDLVASLRASGAMRRVLAASAGATPILVAWLALEIVRFGAPLSSYRGQHFSHPWLDGAWRLTVGLNEGLLWYFPLVILSVAGVVALLRRRELLGSALALAVPPAVTLALISAWWAWDGSAGWGPRLLVPVVPLLAAAAACAMGAGGWRRRAALVLLPLAVLVNALGVLQADTPTGFYLDACGSVVVPEEELAWYPDGLAKMQGEPRISRSMATPRDAAFSPLRLHAFLLATRVASLTPEERARVLVAPPWLDARPDVVPRLRGTRGQMSGVLLGYLTSPFAWPHLGAVLAASPQERLDGFAASYQDALADQVLRAFDTDRRDRALELSETYWRLAGTPYAAALRAEALRASGAPLDPFLASLSVEARGSAEMHVVLALAARDRGDEPAARAHLEAAAPWFRAGVLTMAVASPLAEWPSGMRQVISPG